MIFPANRGDNIEDHRKTATRTTSRSLSGPKSFSYFGLEFNNRLIPVFAPDDRDSGWQGSLRAANTFFRGQNKLRRYHVSTDQTRQTYPYPSFVLAVPFHPCSTSSWRSGRPVFISRDTDVTVKDDQRHSSFPGDISPDSSVTIVWSNEKWLQIFEGRPLADCLSSDDLFDMEEWIRGAESPIEEAPFRLIIDSPSIQLTLTKTFITTSFDSGDVRFCIVTSQPVPSKAKLHTSSATHARSSTSDVNIPLHPFEGNPADIRRGSGGSIKPSPLFLSHQAAPPSESGRSPHSPTSPPRPRLNTTSHRTLAVPEEYWALVEGTDWARSSIGPRHLWKDELDPLISFVFQSNTMDCLLLGEDLHLLYNQHYSSLVDHPSSFGQPAMTVWKLMWPHLERYINQALKGASVTHDNDLMLFKPFGPGTLLETYFNWRYVPLAASDSKTIGLYTQAWETTDAVLLERRLITTRELSEQLLLARSEKEVFSSLVDVMSDNPKDLPFGLFYSVNPMASNYPTPTTVATTVKLESTFGVPENHLFAPKSMQINLPVKSVSLFGNARTQGLSSPTMSAISVMSSGSGRRIHRFEGSSWPIQKALSTRQCVQVDDCRALIEGYSVRQWDELPISALVVPICTETSLDTPSAVMIVGLNLRRPFDTPYDAWLHEIRILVASAMVSVKAFQIDQRRMKDDRDIEKAKTAWFQAAAHDLRTPLTLIDGPLEELLALEEFRPSDRKKLRLAKKNVERLSRSVSALMDFSALELGRVTVAYQGIDLGKFVGQIAALFQPVFQELHVVYEVLVEPHNGSILADPRLLEKILSNLISNAAKFTERGRVTVRLTYGECAEISVVDTGIGILERNIEHITEWPHHPASGSGAPETILGLALAKKLLDLLNGQLDLSTKSVEEDPVNHGSTFTVKLPIMQREKTISPDASLEEVGRYGRAAVQEALALIRDSRTKSETKSNEGNSASEAQVSTVSGTGTRLFDELVFEKSDVLLVADEDSEIRDYIRSIFVPFCQVIEAASADRVLDMVSSNPPNLVLADSMMLQLNGLELLAAIRERSLVHVPVVLLSAAADDEFRNNALLAGAEDFMHKPFKIRGLLHRVHLHMQIGKRRLKMEQEFAEREVKLRFLLEYCPSGIMQADSRGRFTYLNQSYRKLAGMTEDEDANNWPLYVDSVTEQRLVAQWRPFLVGEEKELRITWRWTNGCATMAIFVRLDLVSSTMTGVIGCISDITQEEQRLAEAEQRRKEAEESRHQQELLIDLTSHEMRTPVSAILQSSALVKENLSDLRDQLSLTGSDGFRPTKALMQDLEEDIQALEGITQCGLVQERIAGDILSLARIQMDMLSVHDVCMHIKTEASKIFSVFGSEARTKKIKMALEFGPSLEACKVTAVMTDPVRLGQVVTNLISNAIRFTSTSSIRKVTVRYDVSLTPPDIDSCGVPRTSNPPSVIPVPSNMEVWLFVSVTDTGPGLAPEELSLLFKRFSQSNKMIHTMYGGSGLGLFICRKITELLGGRIEVQSQQGKGTVFRFYIASRTASPLMSSQTAADIPHLSDVTSGSRAHSGTVAPKSPQGTPVVHGPTISPLHLLVVEDNVINQRVLQRQLIKAGLKCDVAENGLEALKLVFEADQQGKRSGTNGKRSYDIILMDLEMPVMDGLTAIREIRLVESKGTHDRKIVIAVTGNARQGQMEDALAAGMDAVMLKPYVLSNLLQKIQALWQKKASPHAERTV